MTKIKYPQLFTIKPYEINTVYSAVGEIIEKSQMWEEEYRECVRAFGVKMKDLHRKTLVKINQKLRIRKIISQKEYEALNEVISLRNDINHVFFIKIMKNCRTEEDWDNINSYLNTVITFINEARDLVNNILNQFNPNHIHVRNVFDDDTKELE